MTALVLAAVFAAAAGAGFVLEHEPAPDELRLTIDREPPPPGPESTVGGEVVSSEGGRLTLRTADGLVELELPDGVVVERLLRANLSEFAPGDTVNLGGEFGEFGLVLTGVVKIEAP